MKKYLAFTAVFGAFALLSLSAPAQAQAPAASAPEAGAAMKAMVPPATASDYTKDRAECDALASAASTEGAAPAEADKAVALKKCLISKGHSEEEVNKAEAATTPPAAPAAAEAK